MKPSFLEKNTIHSFPQNTFLFFLLIFVKPTLYRVDISNELRHKMMPTFVAEVSPVEGLGCEVLVGSVNCPSLKRLYKPCSKLTEGKCPLYGIGFNFMDARYYDTFATVGGNRVSS